MQVSLKLCCSLSPFVYILPQPSLTQVQELAQSLTLQLLFVIWQDIGGYSVGRRGSDSLSSETLSATFTLHLPEGGLQERTASSLSSAYSLLLYVYCCWVLCMCCRTPLHTLYTLHPPRSGDYSFNLFGQVHYLLSLR